MKTSAFSRGEPETFKILLDGVNFKPINSSIVGVFVKLLPFIPNRGRVFYNWAIFKRVLYSLMASWILSLFLTALNRYYLEFTSLSLAVGRGTTLVNFPSFTRNNRSRFSTFIWVGLPGGNKGSIAFDIKGFPLSLAD